MGRGIKEKFEDKFDEISRVILISDDDERVKEIERQLLASGDLTYFDPIWKRHFKHADMFHKDKRPVNQETGEYYGQIYY